MVLEGGQPNVYVRLQGGEGGKKCPEFCLRGLYTVPKEICLHHLLPINKQFEVPNIEN